MYIGVDIGGTTIKSALFSSSYKLVKYFECKTDAKKGKKVVLDNILFAIESIYPEGENVSSIGIAIRGAIDSEKGVVVKTTMMPKGMNNFNLADVIRKRFKVAVVMENDVNCFTLGEAVFGAGKNYNIVAGIAIGTGFGAGLVIDGKIYHGSTFTAVEFGHSIANPDGERWNCGQKGCFESYVSGRAMEMMYRRYTGRRKNTFEIEKLYYSRDKYARQVFDTMAKYLAISIANMITILNPDVIVIGGGIGKIKALTEKAKKNYRKYLPYPNIQKVKIKYSRLGSKAGVVGAAYMSYQRIKSK